MSDFLVQRDGQEIDDFGILLMFIFLIPWVYKIHTPRNPVPIANELAVLGVIIPIPL